MSEEGNISSVHGSDLEALMYELSISSSLLDSDSSSSSDYEMV